MTRRAGLWIGFAVLIALGAMSLVNLAPPRRPTEPNVVALKSIALPVATRPADASTRPAAPATAALAAPPADVLAVVRLDDPAYPTTRPLDLPADLADAAKIVLRRPAYADPAGNLWLTHPAGRPVADLLAGPVVDRTAVVRETVRYVNWPTDGGPAAAVVGTAGGGLDAVTLGGRSPVDLPGADFDRALPTPAGVIVPTRDGAAVLSADLAHARPVALTFGDAAPNAPNSPTPNPPVLAAAADGVWVWSPWENGRPGSDGVVFVDAAGSHPRGATEKAGADGWPAKVIEIVPLADGGVLVVYDGGSGPALKLIPAAEKPPTAELLRTIRGLARRLADPDPLAREAAQRAIEAQGPAALPVLESLREQLPPEAQVRIETLLGQRFAPTLAGLRPLDGRCRTLSRFAGGGCVLRLDGGGTLDDDGNSPARSVIPATILIRPGQFNQRIEPEAVCDFVPKLPWNPDDVRPAAGGQTIQSVGGELIIADAKAGARRWIGLTLRPIAGRGYEDFDTVVAIDGRRRWLLRSERQPGATLLIDPSLPDTTPKLPVWTLAGDAVGRTDAGWPAIRRGDRLFVLDRTAWRPDEPELLRTDFADASPPPDAAGRRFAAIDGGVEMTDPTGRRTGTTLPAGVGTPRLAVLPGRLLVYTSDGKVRRYATDGDRSPTLEATFTQGVPVRADHVWLDPAGRLVMTCGASMAIAFPEGRVPGGLADLMLRVER